MPFQPWLFTVAHHACLDYLRSVQRTPTTVFSHLEPPTDDQECSAVALLLDSQPLPEEVIESQEVQHILVAAINRLPSHYRTLIVLRYYGQYSPGEISRIIKMPENTVRASINRAKRLLREDVRIRLLLTSC